MKKYLLMSLIGIMSLTIVGCGSETTDKKEEDKEPTEKVLSCVKNDDEKDIVKYTYDLDGENIKEVYMTLHLPSDFDITPTQFCENEFPDGMTCNAIHDNTYVEMIYDPEVVSIEDLEDYSIDVGTYEVIKKSLVEEFDYICE